MTRVLLGYIEADYEQPTNNIKRSTLDEIASQASLRATVDIVTGLLNDWTRDTPVSAGGFSDFRIPPYRERRAGLSDA